LNDELQGRNRDLSLLGDDLTNLFNGLNVAVILLNKDLRIRKFTPMAEKMLRLIPTDIGRPVTDIRPNIDIPDLEKILLDVVATVTPRQFEAQDPLGKWYSVKIRPYRTSDDRINGIVLLFTDINDLKTGLIYSQSLENTISQPLLILGGDLIVKRANKKFYDVFKSTPADTENHFIYKVGNGQWDIPQLRKLLGEVLPTNTDFRDFEVTHRFPSIGEKTMRLSGCRLFFEDKATETIILAIEVR
jgi:two-component system CheB/CheR fusion protein